MSTLFYNAKIFTGKKFLPAADAVYVKGNKIKNVGNYSEIKQQIPTGVRSIDLKQKIILPGFIDTHTHFVNYALSKSEIDLSTASSMEQIKNILIEFKKSSIEDRTWISGYGWNGNKLQNSKKLDRKFLDKIFPHTPVSLSSKDLHTFVCNSKALDKLNLEEANLPEGSSIGYYSDGSYNGRLLERAWLLIEEAKPQLSATIKKQLVKEAISQANEYGLTGIHIMEEESAYDLLANIRDEGDLTLRVCWHFPLEMLDEMIGRGVKSYKGDEWLKIGGVKLFMDGSIGSETAYMFHSYKSDPDNFGYLVCSAEEYYKTILKAGLHGISPTTHSIGDKSNYLVVNAIQKVMKNPRVNSKELLPRIEHFQIARPEEQDRVAENQIYCAMQPAHIGLDAAATTRKIGKFGSNSYPFRSLLNKGAKIGFGSDAPVVSLNPFLGIYAAVERKGENNPTQKSWIRQEKITPEEAIRCYTFAAAYGSRDQNRRGSVEPGKLADLIILEDYTKYDSNFWLGTKPLLTMVGGEIVHNIL